LEKLRQQLTEKKIIFSVTPAAKKWLASRGYDKKMGARPMTRVIQEKVRLPIVESMLRDDSEKRIEEIIVTVRGDELVFEYRKQQQLIEENG
jgi:ATP-dependent Clp protease ATP-binding subunit ClpA